jgi:hypothetical protein
MSNEITNDEVKSEEAKVEEKKEPFNIKICYDWRAEAVPEYMKAHKELVGISIGACVLTGKWSKGYKLRDKDNNFIKKEGKFLREPEACAHAHTHGSGKGFICFRTTEDLKKETTVKHELAHIITGSGHTKKWAEAYVQLVSDMKKTSKWLTVEWLQRKYGFDNEGGEGLNVYKEYLKAIGVDESELKK